MFLILVAKIQIRIVNAKIKRERTYYILAKSVIRMFFLTNLQIYEFTNLHYMKRVEISRLPLFTKNFSIKVLAQGQPPSGRSTRPP